MQTLDSCMEELFSEDRFRHDDVLLTHQLALTQLHGTRRTLPVTHSSVITMDPLGCQQDSYIHPQLVCTEWSRSNWRLAKCSVNSPTIIIIICSDGSINGLVFAKGTDPLSDTVVRQTDFDVTIRQRVVSDRNLACTLLIRHKTLSDGKVKACLLPH